MNDKKRILILLKILDQFQQDNEDARNGLEKSIAAISKDEEGITFKKFSFFLWCIYVLSAVTRNDINSSLTVWRDSIYMYFRFKTRENVQIFFRFPQKF